MGKRLGRFRFLAHPEGPLARCPRPRCCEGHCPPGPGLARPVCEGVSCPGRGADLAGRRVGFRCWVQGPGGVLSSTSTQVGRRRSPGPGPRTSRRSVCANGLRGVRGRPAAMAPLAERRGVVGGRGVVEIRCGSRSRSAEGMRTRSGRGPLPEFFHARDFCGFPRGGRELQRGPSGGPSGQLKEGADAVTADDWPPAVMLRLAQRLDNFRNARAFREASPAHPPGWSPIRVR